MLRSSWHIILQALFEVHAVSWPGAYCIGCGLTRYWRNEGHLE